MNFAFRFMSRLELSTIMRLAVLLAGPAASLTMDGGSPAFFALLMLTNLAGVVCGVIMFKVRLARQSAIFLKPAA